MKQSGNNNFNSHLLTLGERGPVQMGFWNPNRLWTTVKFLIPLRKGIAEKRKAGTLTPMRQEVLEFKTWVTDHSIYHMWVRSMIKQANEFILLHLDDFREIEQEGNPVWIDGCDSFFDILNEIITTSPSFNDTIMVGTPLNGFLAVSMATEAGLSLFHDTMFNLQFKNVLDAWNTFLNSRDSMDKLDIHNPEKSGSWISKAAWKAGVWDQMVCDPTQPGYGYDSWNKFLIRKFVPDARPFHGDPKTSINIGCETTPWHYANEITCETDFWIKDVNYSLLDLFGGRRQWVECFEGGQAYQGFLSATDYHRWHAPLDGAIIHSWVQPGTFFAQRPRPSKCNGVWEDAESQPYLGHLATRSIFIFKHEICGYVALICIGMVEVSTYVIKPSKYIVDEGSNSVSIIRGEEIGHIEFGGSTHVMVFQKGKVNLEDWAINSEQHRNDNKPTPMGTIIATVSE